MSNPTFVYYDDTGKRIGLPPWQEFNGDIGDGVLDYMANSKASDITNPSFSIKDSGEREGFNTNAVRDTEEGKGNYALLPLYALERLAIHMQSGAKKYGADNWRKGMPLMRYLSSAFRHLSKWAIGYTDEDHLAAALFNVCCIIETERMIADGKVASELNDRKDWYKLG